jgi:hypothetical protein
MSKLATPEQRAWIQGATRKQPDELPERVEAPSADEQQWLARSPAVQKSLLALKDKGAEAGTLQTLFTFCQGKAGTKEFKAALQGLDRLEKLLAAGGAGGEPPPTPPSGNGAGTDAAAKLREQAAALRRELDALDRPADLEEARLAIVAQLERLEVEPAAKALEQHKAAVANLNSAVASLRSELAGLGAVPAAMAEAQKAITADLDRGALVAAQAKAGPFKESLRELKALADRFAELKKTPAADLGESRQLVQGQLDAGDLAGARLSVPKYEQDLAKLNQALSNLNGELAKLPEVPKLAAERKAVTDNVALGAAGAATNALVAYREMLNRRLADVGRRLRALDPAPPELTGDRARVQKALDESNVVAAFADFELYERKRNATLATSLPADLDKLVRGLPPEIRDLPKMQALIAAVKDRLDCRDFAGARKKLKSCEKFAAGIQDPASKKFLDKEQIRAELNRTYDRAASLPIMLMKDGKNSSAEAWRNAVRKALHDNPTDENNVAARAELDAFKKEIDRAVRATPRAAVEMQQLLEIEEQHQKIAVQNANYARNTEMARSLAVSIVKEDGSLALGGDPLWADMPFAPTDEVSAARGALEGADVAALAPSKHASAMLKRLVTDKKLQDTLNSIKKPDPANPACAMVRATLGLPADVEVTEVHARQAAVSALLSQLRQNDVGSCFATAIAIEAQAKKPDVFLEDMKSLLETGKVVRQRTKLDSKVKLRRADADVPATPGLDAALAALGIARGDMAAARRAALVELRKATPTATEDEFTPEQIFKQITENRKGSKTPEEVARELQTAKDAFLAAGKVELPLNLDMSPTDLRREIPVKTGPTDLHTAPAFTAALDGLGVEPKDRQQLIQNALTKLQAGSTATEFKFTAEQILKQVVKDRVKTTPPDPPEKAESELAAATKAFQATQDNRLLRAWEYTVTEMAELSEEQGAEIRRGTQTAATDRVNTVVIPASGPDVARLAQFRKDVNAKFDKLFKERVKIRYDASVETEKSADGSSSRGVWVMEDAATHTKIVDKAGQDAIIKKLMAEVLADFKDPKEQGWGVTLTGNLNSGPLTTADPPKKSGAAYGAIESMMAAFNNVEKVPLVQTRPADGTQLFTWLVEQNQRMHADIGSDVATNPDGAALPLRGGPHVFSLRPGTPFLQTVAADKSKTPATHVAEYVGKNKLKDTKLAVTPGQDGPARRAVKRAIENSLHPNWVAVGYQKLEALGTDISVADLSRVVDGVDTQLRDVQRGIRDGGKAKNREEQAKAALAPPPASGPLPLTNPLEGKVLAYVTRAVGGGSGPRFTKIKSALEAQAAGKAQITVSELQAELDKLLDQDQANADTATRTAWKDGGQKGLQEDVVKDGPLASAVKISLDPVNPDLNKLVTKALTGVPNASTLRPLLEARITRLRDAKRTELTLQDLRKELEAVVNVDSGETNGSVKAANLAKINAGLGDAVAGDAPQIAVGLPLTDPLQSPLLDVVNAGLKGVPSMFQAAGREQVRLALVALSKPAVSPQEVKTALNQWVDGQIATGQQAQRDKAKAEQRKQLKGAELEDTAPVPPVPLATPLAGPAKKFVDKALAGLDPKYAGKARTKLEALAASQPNASLDQVQKVVNEVMDEYLAGPEFQAKKDGWKAGNQQKLGEDLLANGAAVSMPLNPTTGPLAALVAKSLTRFDAGTANVLRPLINQRLTALQSTGAATINLAQIGKIVTDVVRVDLATQPPNVQDGVLGLLNGNLADGLAGDAPVYEPTFAVNAPEVARLVGQWATATGSPVEVWKQLANQQIAALGKDPVTLKEVRQALDTTGAKEEEGWAKNAAKAEFDKAVFEDTTGDVAELPLAYPPDGKLKDMIDKSLAHLTGNWPTTLKKKAEEELAKLKPATTVSLPQVRKMLDDLIDVHMLADHNKEADNAKKSAMNNLAAAVLDDLGPPLDVAQVEDLVTKTLKKLKVAEPQPTNTVKTAAVSALQSRGPAGLSLAEVEKEVATALKASSLPADGVLETLRDERRPPLDLAKVEPLVALTLKKLRVPAAKTAAIRKAAVDAVTKLNKPQVGLPEIEEAVVKAYKAVKTPEDEMFDKLATEETAPIAAAAVEALVEKMLKRLDVPGDQNALKARAVQAVKALNQPATPLAEIEKEVRKVLNEAGLSTEAKVGKKLREAPPGVVFADSNWGGGDQATLFTMVVNPLTDKPEMWQCEEDGSGARPMDQKQWVEGAEWGVASDPKQVGGAV